MVDFGTTTCIDLEVKDEFTLDHGFWEDLRFPAQGINPAGAAAPPTIDTTTYPGTLLFSGTNDNHIAGVAQLPHCWLRESAVRPHIHWAKTTSEAGVVVWQFRHAIADIGGTFSSYSDWITGTAVVSDSNTANKHALVTFGDVAMTDIGESGIILWELRRFASDASDSYIAVNARFFELDFHYQVEKFGTYNEIPD